MRKQLLSFVCISGLSAAGLLLWHQPARAADDVRTTDIVSPGPKFAEEHRNKCRSVNKMGAEDGPRGTPQLGSAKARWQGGSRSCSGVPQPRNANL
jgi:hypothetical protein